LNSLTNSGIIVLTVILNILPFHAWGQELELSEYEDQEGRFTIDYPSDWIVNEEPSSNNKDKVVQFDSSEPDMSLGVDSSSPAVQILISDAKPDETSLEALTNKKVSQMESIGLPIEESEQTTLSGLPAHTAKAEIASDESAKNVWALYDGKVYQVTLRAPSHEYDDLLPTFQQMIESFQIVNQTLGQEGDVVGEDQANEGGDTEEDQLFG
jgi:PsbP